MLSKVLAGALGLAVVALLFLWNQNSRLQEDLATAKAGISQAKQTNKTNVDRIDELLEDYNTCVADKEVDRKANEATVSALKDDLVAAERASSKVRIRTKEIFREPSCEELGSINIAAVCPDLAGSMRSTARGLDRSGLQGEEGSSQGEDAE